MTIYHGDATIRFFAFSDPTPSLGEPHRAGKGPWAHPCIGPGAHDVFRLSGLLISLGGEQLREGLDVVPIDGDQVAVFPPVAGGRVPWACC